MNLMSSIVVEQPELGEIHYVNHNMNLIKASEKFHFHTSELIFEFCKLRFRWKLDLVARRKFCKAFQSFNYSLSHQRT